MISTVAEITSAAAGLAVASVAESYVVVVVAASTVAVEKTSSKFRYLDHIIYKNNKFPDLNIL